MGIFHGNIFSNPYETNHYFLFSKNEKNKASLRDLIAATGRVISNWIQIVDFSSRVTLKFDGWPRKNRALLLYYVKLCASFQNHQWIQTGVTVRKRSIWIAVDDILSRVTLKFEGWPWKTIWHLFYTTSSFVHHFKSIGEVKLELQSGNAQFRSKLVIFCSAWTWNLTNDLEKQYGISSIILLSVLFQSHGWIQTGITVRKRLSGVMISVTFCMDITCVIGNNS